MTNLNLKSASKRSTCTSYLRRILRTKHRCRFLAAGSTFKARVYILPVNNVKDCFHVIGSYIFVLQIVGMFPNINAKKRNETSCGLKRILIRTSRYFKRFCFLIISEPAPTRALNRYGCFR